MKTESTVKYVLRIALTLLAITAVVAVILAAVNSVTAPRIAAQNEQKTQVAIEAVLPGGGICPAEEKGARNILGSLPTITAIFGLTVANEAIKQLSGYKTVK